MREVSIAEAVNRRIFGAVMNRKIRHVGEPVAGEGQFRSDHVKCGTQVGGSCASRTRQLYWASRALASTTASAVMLTMRLTVAVGVKICADLATPRRMGPTVTLSPSALSKLKEMLAASR